jgi:hypothetical protein
MAVWLLCQALQSKNKRGYDLTGEHEVIYIAPTFAQAHGMFWPKIKKLAEPVTAKAMENTGILYLTNGRRIRLFGMDNPDAARGIAIGAVGFDEYADMPARAWDEVVQPALMDVEGEAMFIGTPKGKNHFYDLFVNAANSPDWEAFNFTSHDNPLLAPEELARMTRTMSTDTMRQEIEASFTSAEGKVFKREWFKVQKDEPLDGIYHIAVDLAGFSTGEKNKKEKVRRDNTAIAVVKSHPGGWWVKDIIWGQWDTFETARKIVAAASLYQAPTVGIEKGALMNAVTPYMNDLMRRHNRYLNLVPLSHGNQQKTNRIMWALQGRLEKGRITFAPDAERKWFEKLKDEALDFPDPRARDDLLDALAYIDQLDKGHAFFEYDTPTHSDFRPLDSLAGY